MMTANQLIVNDIKEILNTFSYYIEHYENDLKSKVTLEDIKDHFKATIFIEKTIRKMEEKGIIEQFMKCLNSWLKSIKRTIIYDLNFYKFACDQMLLKYFKASKYDIEIAIRMYSSNCNEERFEKVIEKLILESGINESVLNYLIYNKDELNVTEIESRLMLLNWNNEIQSGKYIDVKICIEKMFDSYRIDTYLPIFIQILTLDLTEQELPIKNMILKILLYKMEDRSVLSKEFWLTLVQNIDKKLILDLSREYRDFLTALIKFFVYCGCMMNHENNGNDRHWFGSPEKSICPEITFNEIVNIVKLLLSLNIDSANYIETYLEDAKVATNSLFVVDLIKICL